jgi:hypothetical protein
MTALLRYAILKSMRENLLIAVLISPAVLLASPLLVTAGLDLVEGRATYPFAIVTISPAASSELLIAIAVAVSSLAAGAGSFWIFRPEAANRSIGFFLLAARPRAIALTATIYGACAGIASYLLALACVVVLTSHLHSHGWMFFSFVVVNSLFASALGTALVGISPEVTMLVPGYAGSMAVSFLLLNTKGPMVILVLTVAGALLLITAASMLVRRRCAV